MLMSKTIYVIAGSIGSGKTTIANLLLKYPDFKDIEYVNADLYARMYFGISSDNKANHELAKKYQIFKIDRLINQGKDFIVEVVPTKEKKVSFLRKAKDIYGYKIIILYIYTDDVCINLSRVNKRNASGDFYVSDDEVISRFDICNKNIVLLKSIADELLFVNNSSNGCNL